MAECSPMVRETGVQSQVELCQRVKNGTWCLLANTDPYKVWIKGKWCNAGRGVASSLNIGVLANEKEAFGSLSTMVGQLTTNLYAHISRDSSNTNTNANWLKGSLWHQGFFCWCPYTWVLAYLFYVALIVIWLYTVIGFYVNNNNSILTNSFK